MNIFSIVGARPQFIKLAPLSKVLRKYHRETIIHTGQHYDEIMSDTFFKDLDIPKPDYNIGVGSGSHGIQTGKMLIELESILLAGNPDLVIVYGDTNSTLAGALAAAKLHIPIVHVEAGLRSFNRRMPEEINRVMVDHISDLLFVPTESAYSNLHFEGLLQRAHLTGDIMVDALKQNLPIALKKSTTKVVGEYYLLTLHRPSNVDNPKILYNIIKTLSQSDERIVFPIHPRTKKMLKSLITPIPLRNIHIMDAVGYLDFLSLEYHAKKIITDSGGVQKEAYLLQKPCITLRSETEWIETYYAGWNLVLDPYEKFTWEEIESFNPSIEQVSNYKNIFGENVAEKMVNIINRKGGGT
jgi:UDP-N-acetylglucosamine 2-epimerase